MLRGGIKNARRRSKEISVVVTPNLSMFEWITTYL